MRIVFIRHGDPDYETDTLTAEGRKQASAVAKRLLDENIDKIYNFALQFWHLTSLIVISPQISHIIQ